MRGEDHLANSARHLLLLRALGAVEPVFAHCPIIVGADGERLSTRRGAEPLAALRARGVPPEAVVAYAAQLACPAQGGAERGRVVRRARRGASRSRASAAARRMPIPRIWPGWAGGAGGSPLEELARRLAAVPAGGHAGVRAGRRSPRRRAAPRRSARSPTVLRQLAQRPAGRRRPLPALALFCELREADAREHLPYAAAVELIDRLRALGQSRGLSPRDVLHPLRIALTGAPRGLPLPVVVAVLPREEALERCRT